MTLLPIGARGPESRATPGASSRACPSAHPTERSTLASFKKKSLCRRAKKGTVLGCPFAGLDMPRRDATELEPALTGPDLIRRDTTRPDTTSERDGYHVLRPHCTRPLNK